MGLVVRGGGLVVSGVAWYRWLGAWGTRRSFVTACRVRFRRRRRAFGLCASCCEASPILAGGSASRPSRTHGCGAAKGADSISRNRLLESDPDFGVESERRPYLAVRVWLWCVRCPQAGTVIMCPMGARTTRPPRNATVKGLRMAVRLRLRNRVNRETHL